VPTSLYSDIIKKMLEKNLKKMCDSHFHYADCVKNAEIFNNIYWNCCSSFHSPQEFQLYEDSSEKFLCSYGIHPLQCSNNQINITEYLIFLESLLQKNKLCAIGEIGFDFFTDNGKKNSELQVQVWNNQLELALQYKMPVVIHCRKANEKLFEYSKILKKLPSVLFHSFMGSFIEAESLIKRGINCYFSFGKQMLNGNKKVIQCVQNLPETNLLLETDAPYQTLKNENNTFPNEIQKVYDAAIALRNADENAFVLQMERNFFSMFSTSNYSN